MTATTTTSVANTPPPPLLFYHSLNYYNIRSGCGDGCNIGVGIAVRLHYTYAHLTRLTRVSRSPARFRACAYSYARIVSEHWRVPGDWRQARWPVNGACSPSDGDVVEQHSTHARTSASFDITLNLLLHNSINMIARRTRSFTRLAHAIQNTIIMRRVDARVRVRTIILYPTVFALRDDRDRDDMRRCCAIHERLRQFQLRSRRRV